MVKGVKEKDVTDFEQCVKTLNEIVERIRECNPEVNVFFAEAEVCLMAKELGKSEGVDNKDIVTRVRMKHADSGAF